MVRLTNAIVQNMRSQQQGKAGESDDVDEVLGIGGGMSLEDIGEHSSEWQGSVAAAAEPKRQGWQEQLQHQHQWWQQQCWQYQQLLHQQQWGGFSGISGRSSSSSNGSTSSHRTPAAAGARLDIKYT